MQAFISIEEHLFRITDVSVAGSDAEAVLGGVKYKESSFMDLSPKGCGELGAGQA